MLTVHMRLFLAIIWTFSLITLPAASATALNNQGSGSLFPAAVMKNIEPTNDPMSLAESLKILRTSFDNGATRPLKWRVGQLKAIKRMISENRKEIVEAISSDLGRGYFETEGLECLSIDGEADYVLKNLQNWIKPVFTPVPAMVEPASSEYVHQPLGICLIIGPFNYPIALLLKPLVGAIAAGNCVIMKPSEVSAASEKLISRLIPAYLDNDCIRVVTGGITETTKLLSLQWDKIFFTGSTRVGKIVMEAAAKHLTPVSLELGGKSPTVIDESVTDLALVARRVLWGKLVNAGQTCIAPDYVLCHASKYDEFLSTAVKVLKDFYGPDAQKSPDYCRIVTQAHCERLQGLLADHSGRVVVGGRVDVSDRYVEPTIVADVRVDSKLMSEEIFGPILPVIKYETVDEAIDIMRDPRLGKPLAMYIFSKNRQTINKITSQVPSGDVVVNDVVFHYVSPHLPFGGVGPSGVGDSNGHFSFQAFSYRRAFLRRDDHSLFDIPQRYPPYSPFGLKLFQFAGKVPSLPLFLKSRTFLALSTILLATGGAIAANTYWGNK